RIKSLRKVRMSGRYYKIKKVYPKRILKPSKNLGGYLIVTFCRNGKPRYYSVHRIILLTFIGESKLQCNHKNGIKTDNRLKNLEYVTSSENHKHARALGLENSNHYLGEKNTSCKLTREKVLEIRELHQENNLNYVELAKLFNVTQGNIYCIIRRKTWKHI
ncbi:MAG: HNH endonuclease, partial [Candidatus Hodarchaeota archaeon]